MVLRKFVSYRETGYAGCHVREIIEKHQLIVMIAPKKNHKIGIDDDQDIHKRRDTLDSFLAKLKQSRLIATRDETSRSTFVAVVRISALCIIVG
jgi:hypothetical protein